ncbi:UNVERIFIED_CONTAM: protein required for normal CLN1 and CLN2 G1 cyclin expression [Siphonaria sp. JEL0065]|nr:protein required for normal CLN1 and CLN2 G1 cyclin expression [Siphonaria sp. JEL0065]
MQTNAKEENDYILNILTDEKAPMNLYLDFAREFHRLNITDYVEKSLAMGAERGASESLKDAAYVKILHALALHFIESASQISKSDTSSHSIGSASQHRSSLLSKATEYLNKADSIDSKNVWTAIVRGSLNLASSKLADSIKAFTFAVNAEGNNLAALMGIGAAQFRSQDYKSALKTFQKILTLYPSYTTPDPRIAIGLCYHRLQMPKEARAAFQRASDLDPNIARGREGGGVGSCLSGGSGANGKRNGAVLNLVAEGLYFRGEFDKVEAVSKAALINTESNIVKAEAYGTLAKALHSQGKYTSAFAMYSKAASLNTSSIAYQYGMGQMYIHQGEHQKALDCFEKVLAKDEENLEALKKVASICSEHPKLLDKSLVYFGKLQALIKKYEGAEGIENGVAKADAGLFPDPVMQVELSKIYETTNPAIALKGYLNALEKLEATGSAASVVEVLNNIGALHHRDAQTQKDFETAKSYYERALAAAENAPENSDKYELRITVQYNLARLHEQLGNPDAARSEYNSILDSHPSYFDCYLRLAALPPSSGGSNRFEESRSQIRKGLFVDRRTSLLMLGHSYFEDPSNKANLRDARKSFEEVLQNAEKNDSFALCSVGNIYLVIARFDPKQKETHVKKALEFFDKAVRVDNKNVFGATGVGICLAELGKFEHAKDVFTQVLEGAANMPSVSVNLAHVLVELGQIKLAITHYERVLKKNLEQNVYVLQCLARAYYIAAKSEKDPEAMLKSLNNIQRAIRVDPTKWSLYYDLALVKQQYAQVMNDQGTDKRTVSGLKKAVEGLEASQRIFTVLGEKTAHQSLGYDVKQANDRRDYCKDLLRVAEKKIHETSVLEEQKQIRLQAIKEQQMKIEQAQAEKERVIREKEQRDREVVEQKRREIMQKMQEENRKARERAELEEEEEARKPVKRKKQDIVNSDESEPEGGDVDEEGGGREKEKKKKRKKKEKKSREEGDEEREGGGEKKRKLVSKRMIVDEEDEEGDRAAPKVGRPSNLSRAVVDSDDDE